jgi:exonuclease III
MAYWKPGHFNTLTNRQRQWSFLLALAPDIALLQECRPGDFARWAPAWAHDEYEVVGANPINGTACSAVLARRSLSPTALGWDHLSPKVQGWFEYFGGYLRLASIAVDNSQIVVVSVHGTARLVTAPGFSEDDQRAVARPALGQAWNNDLAAAAVRALVAHQDHFIIGGDWNTARLMDTFPHFGPPSAVEFFRTLSTWGWCESLRKFHSDEIKTYLDPNSAPYELDHMFTDTTLHGRLQRCDVLDYAVVSELSDHAPLIADFAIDVGVIPVSGPEDGEGA